MNHNSMNGKSFSAGLLAIMLVAGTVGTAFGQSERPRQPGNRQPGGNNPGGNNRGGGQQGGQPGGGPGGMGGRMGGMFGGQDGPAVSARQVDKYGKMLDLTKDQQAAVKALYEGYSEQSKAASEKSREQMRTMRDEMRDSDDRQAAMEKMQKAMTESRAATKKMDEQFNSDVKALLTPEQMTKWPTVEQTQRREASIRRGFVSGERVDLVTLVEDMKVSADVMKTVQPILDTYAAELDRALVKRNAFQEAQMGKMGEMFRNGETDGIQKMVEEGRTLDVAVRDVNRKYAKQVEAALPADQKAAFDAKFKAESFPQVYRTSQTATQLSAAAKLKDLTKEQQDALTAMTASYEKSVASVNDKLAAATEEQEMKFNVANFGRGGGQGGDEESAAGKLRTEKRELEKTTGESLKKLLTPEQQAKMPKPEARDQNGGGRRRGGQGGPDGADQEN